MKCCVIHSVLGTHKVSRDADIPVPVFLYLFAHQLMLSAILVGFCTRDLDERLSVEF